MAFWQYSKVNFNCIFLNQRLHKNVCVCAREHMCARTCTCTHMRALMCLCMWICYSMHVKVRGQNFLNLFSPFTIGPGIKFLSLGPCVRQVPLSTLRCLSVTYFCMDEVHQVPVRTHQRLPVWSETPKRNKLRLTRREAGGSGWILLWFGFFVLLFDETEKER